MSTHLNKKSQVDLSKYCCNVLFNLVYWKASQEALKRNWLTGINGEEMLVYLYVIVPLTSQGRWSDNSAEDRDRYLTRIQINVICNEIVTI